VIFSGLSPDGKLVEIIELATHPFYLGTQFHPEFKSRPDRPHPLFREFVGACMRRAARPPVHAPAVGAEDEGVQVGVHA
jgi:CTP synthase